MQLYCTALSLQQAQTILIKQISSQKSHLQEELCEFVNIVQAQFAW